MIGRVEENSAFGIHGYLTKRQQKTHTQDIQVAVGRKSEVHVGTAYLLSSVSGESKQYEIEIVSVDSDNENGRCMEFKVTDSTLLSLTGGIVQGMSGTPILQADRGSDTCICQRFDTRLRHFHRRNDAVKNGKN